MTEQAQTQELSLEEQFQASTITLELSVAEVNLLLGALDLAPHKFAVEPIALLKSLVAPQAQEIIERLKQDQEGVELLEETTAE